MIIFLKLVFDDSSSYEIQKKKKLIECPFCNSLKISKSVMAPNITNKSSSTMKTINKQNKLFSNYNKQINKIKSEIEKNFKYVGKKFPEEAVERFIMEKLRMNQFLAKQLKRKVKN